MVEKNQENPDSGKEAFTLVHHRMSRSDKVQKRFRIFISIAFASVACAVTIIALKSQIVNPLRPIHYDPSMMVRVGDVSRVFKIKRDPQKKSKLWFCAAEGIHVYDRDTYEWHRYGMESGLPSEWVYDIAFFDHTVWAATDHGPAVYDSTLRRFRPLLRDDTASSFSVENVADSMAVIYSLSRGLIYFKNARDTIPHPLSIRGLKTNHSVTCLRYVDSVLYIGTEMEELFAYNPFSHAVTKFRFNVKADGGAQVLGIVKEDSSLWVATSLDGVYKTVTPDSLDKVQSFPCKGAFVLCNERDGLWAGSPWGLWRYQKEEDVWVQFMHPQEVSLGDFQVIALYTDSSELWYGTASNGAGYFTKEQVSWHTMRAGLSSPNVAAIACTDSSVYTSYGYAGEYIDRFQLDNMQYEINLNWNDGIGDPSIESLAAFRNRLYFGGFDGFGYLDFSSGKSRYFSNNTPLRAFDIAQMDISDSACLLGTVFGIARYYPQTDSFSLYPSTRTDRVTCLYRKGNLIWYGTLGRGLRLFDVSSGTIVLTTLAGVNRIIGIAEVHRGGTTQLCVATDRSGCFFVDPSSGVPTQIEISKDIAGDDPNAPQNEIRCMARSDSLIWLGTEDAGCFVYDLSKNRWGNFTIYEGLLTNKVRSFCDTRRYLFVGCYGGIHRIDKKNPGLMKAIFGPSG